MAPEKLTFSPLSRRQIEADFSGGHITSGAGLILLREVDKKHQLTQRLATVLDDAAIRYWFTIAGRSSTPPARFPPAGRLRSTGGVTANTVLRLVAFSLPLPVL